MCINWALVTIGNAKITIVPYAQAIVTQNAIKNGCFYEPTQQFYSCVNKNYSGKGI